jgi:hypothetical protein
MKALIQFEVTEPETGWSKTITAFNQNQARDKAWAQYWEPALKRVGFLHFPKSALMVQAIEGGQK